MAQSTYMNFVLRRAFSKTAARFSGAYKTPEEGEAAVRFWRNMSFYVAFPCIGLGMVNAYLDHMEHQNKPRAEFIPYEHLRIRSHKFPWGDGNHSLFHNPVKNALPNGYEVPDPNAGNKHH